MDARYYRRLALELISKAATADKPVMAERLRRRAREYLILAEVFHDTHPPQPPGPEPEQRRPAQQQQQIQPKKNEDDAAC